MKKNDIKKYLSGDIKITHVSLRGTGWKSNIKFRVLSAEYSGEFNLVRVNFLNRSDVPQSEIVPVSAAIFYDLGGWNQSVLGILDEVTFYYLLTDCCGQYGGGVGQKTLKTAAERAEFEESIGQTLSTSFIETSTRNAWHLYD